MKRIRVQDLMLLKLHGVKVVHIVFGLWAVPEVVKIRGSKVKHSKYRLYRLAGMVVNAKKGTCDAGGLINGCLGLAGESGETLDMVKKWIFHDSELDKDHLKKELGDVMWYVAMICYAMGFDLDDVMQTNIDKLKARYPGGFDTYRANHRERGDV